jgi:hypothetical protein
MNAPVPAPATTNLKNITVDLTTLVAIVAAAAAVVSVWSVLNSGIEDMKAKITSLEQKVAALEAKTSSMSKSGNDVLFRTNVGNIRFQYADGIISIRGVNDLPMWQAVCANPNALGKNMWLGNWGGPANTHQICQ